jgi:hypothetical protein
VVLAAPVAIAAFQKEKKPTRIVQILERSRAVSLSHRIGFDSIFDSGGVKTFRFDIDSNYDSI